MTLIHPANPKPLPTYVPPPPPPVVEPIPFIQHIAGFGVVTNPGEQPALLTIQLISDGTMRWASLEVQE